MADMDPGPLHGHAHAPVAPGGIAGSDAAAVAAVATVGIEEAGGPPASEAPQPPHDVQPPSTSTTPATTVTAEAATTEQHEVVVAEASATAEDADDAQRQQPPQAQAASLACVPALSSAASSQSLVLLTAGAPSSGRSDGENKARVPAAAGGPARSPSLSPTPPTSPRSPSSSSRAPKSRRPSPARKGPLVLSASSRSSLSSSGGTRQLQRRDSHGVAVPWSLDDLPNEVLLHILGFLDVNDLLATSRTSHHLRCLCVAPILHTLRRRHIRAALPPLLASPMRPSLADLIARHIFMTSTTVVSRKLARSLASIRLSRRLAARPPAQLLVERCVLPPECAPGIGHVAPALAARTRAVEREKLKDGLRRWVGAVWKREVGRRSERIRRFDESVGVGKVWRMRKFWERVSHDDEGVARP